MIDVNPFDDLIVNEPRRLEPAVSGLNERALDRLLCRFRQLTAGEVPRPQRRLSHAQLVTSAQPGFGKSHLIGRLFRALHGHATLVYVRPFQAPALAFQSLLASVVKELHFPDRSDWQSWKPSEPTQLDALACGVFAHLVADVVERQQGGPTEEVRKLRAHPLEAFGEGMAGDPWTEWMRETFKVNLTAYEQALARRGVELHSPEWLRVLHAYGFSYPDSAVRQACLDWISGQSLSPEEGALIGLRPSELLPPDATAELLNEVSRLRLLDLCRLACFFRPFFFCFDQTEAYGHGASLARSFGMVVATLVNEAVNHLTLITSNQAPWVRTISAHFEDADRERIAHPPITLEGLTREQGEELIRLRLENCGSLAGLATMQDARWLGSLFQSERDQLGTRRFLQHCKERWEELRDRPPPPTVTLPEHYEARRAKLLADPKRLLFDADALKWLVKVCAQGLPDLTLHPNGSGYFSVGWKTPAQHVLFGFEPGANWKRWEAISRHAAERAMKSPPLKAVLFRSAEQPAIPAPDWKIASEIEAAKASHLHLIVLSRDDLATLYAGYDLYGEALGGDIPPYSAEEVTEHLQAVFAPWWERLAGPIVPESIAKDPNPETELRLAAEIRAIVSAQKFLSIEEVIGKLATSATKDDVLKACGHTAEIRIHSHPSMTALQWKVS